jgi:hypothetical protein
LQGAESFAQQLFFIASLNIESNTSYLELACWWVATFTGCVFHIWVTVPFVGELDSLVTELI